MTGALAGGSVHCSSTSPAEASLRGSFEATASGALAQIRFDDATRYTLVRAAPCDGPREVACNDHGTYTVDRDRAQLTLSRHEQLETVAVAAVHWCAERRGGLPCPRRTTRSRPRGQRSWRHGVSLSMRDHRGQRTDDAEHGLSPDRSLKGIPVAVVPFLAP